MRGLLTSVWLLAAALYAASLLFLIQPFSGDEAWPAAPGEALLVLAAVAPEPKIERRNEWVQVAGYTTVVRSRPSSAAPPLLAYSVGRPFRGIAREAGLVRGPGPGSGQ